MSDRARKFRVAAAQVETTFHDASANLPRILAAIEEAAKNGARLVVFSELALSGYPFFIWALPYGDQLVHTGDFYRKAAVEADGPEGEAIRRCCMQNRIRAVVGFSERDGGSLFMSQWVCGPDGSMTVRRKLRPTSVERILYGDGDGSDIRVHKTEVGNLGVLQCWEHAQSLLKYAMSSQHEEVHAASWPVFPAELPHHSLSREANSALLTAYAIETGTFVVSASSFLTKQNIDETSRDKEKMLSPGGGFTTILDPEGRTLALAASDRNEVIYADVDLDLCYKARAVLDPTGHYSRPDVFQVNFDMTPRHVIKVASGSRSSASAGEAHGYRQLRCTLFRQSARPSSPTDNADTAKSSRAEKPDGGDTVDVGGEVANGAE